MAHVARRRPGPRLALLFVTLAVGLVVAACGGSSPTTAPSAAAPSAAPAGSGAGGLDGTWLLTKYTTPDGTEFTVPSAVTPTITFDGDAASGQAGCNSFNAIATVQGDQLRFDQVATTKMACEDPMATVEAAFLQALNLSTTYTVTGDTLVITNPAGKPSLTFVRAT